MKTSLNIEEVKDWYHNLWKVPNNIYIAYVEYAKELPEELLKDVNVDDMEYVGFYYEKGGTYLVLVIEDDSHDEATVEKHCKSLFSIYGNDNLIKGYFPSSVYSQEVIFDRRTCSCEHCKEYRAKNFKPLTMR